MHERIQELEARLVKDSHNSNRPPSSDSLLKKLPPRSRRQLSGHKLGGQPGRRGVTRSLVDDPCQANAMVDETQALETLPASNGEHLRTRYDTILSTAEAGNPPRPRRPGTRGRVTQSPAGNLIRRLRERRNEVLRFLTDLRVPGDNNHAERDLRIPKLKQKASGCFRSEEEHRKARERKRRAECDAPRVGVGPNVSSECGA